MAFIAFMGLIVLSAMINPLVAVSGLVGGSAARAWWHIALAALATGIAIAALSGERAWPMLFLAYPVASACWAATAFLVKRQLQV